MSVAVLMALEDNFLDVVVCSIILISFLCICELRHYQMASCLHYYRILFAIFKIDFLFYLYPFISEKSPVNPGETGDMIHIVA